VPQPFPLVIVGGNSLVGAYLMRRLQVLGLVADVISRRAITVPEGFTFTEMDLSKARNWIAPENAIVVSLLPLWILAQFLPRFIGVKAIIALGSTSRFSKAGSPDTRERSTAAHLELAEDVLKDWSLRSNVHCTILRSTMIYDGVRDLNISRMAKFIRRWRFLPVAAPAIGLRQPIHADDVAKAIVKAMENPAVYDKALNIAGGEVLSYRAMVERVFQKLGITPRIVPLPTGWLQTSFRWASDIGLLNETTFGASIFQRMNQDLIFDIDEGLRLLDYQPRPFAPDFN
jgi:nucleoside-diphosphate-sugar epimerase